MFYTKSFIKTLKETTRGAHSVNQALLERGSFIVQVGSGIFAYLPLGYKVYGKIRKIIVKELNKIGVQEVYLPVLHQAELWKKSGRFEEIGDELIKIRVGKTDEFVLAMTHEEVITNMASKKIQNFQDLPFTLGQISKKIRNEVRPRGGLIRLKEFDMQDAYSFHADADQLDKTFNDFIKSYETIFQLAGLNPIIVEADSGIMGGGDSREFMLPTPVGEDRIYVCPKCKKGFSKEIVPEERVCPNDKVNLKEEKAIELGHIFKLGTKYSEKLNLEFIDQDGKKKPVLMGCYGIGLDRLIAAIIEKNHDEFGIIWPKKVAPIDVYLIDLKGNRGKEIYENLEKEGIKVLFDDRKASAGVKFADADLLGIPNRLVISERSLKEEKIEIKERGSKESRLIDIDKISTELRK